MPNTKTFDLTDEVADAVADLVAMSFVAHLYAGARDTPNGLLLIKKIRAATKTLRRAGILPEMPDGKPYP